MTQLRLVEIEADYDTSLVVEEYNPDCFVLVYAVDDRESFGKNHHHPKTKQDRLTSGFSIWLQTMIDILIYF